MSYDLFVSFVVKGNLEVYTNLERNALFTYELENLMK